MTDNTTAENPKKAHGDMKPSMRFVPTLPLFDVARVFEGGAGKYGIRNWRKQPIRMSTYRDAMLRHLEAWFEGLEDKDSESGRHHLAHVIAGALIVLDSIRLDTAVDDRNEIEVKTRRAAE